MTKIIIVLIILLVASAGVYYGRFLFTKKVVKEDIPASMKSTIKTVKEGGFGEIDFIHKGSGKARLLENQDGRKLIRFEDFQVTNGPDLYVYLTKNPAPTKDIKSLSDFISLGRLKGNVGDQNYEINQNIDGYNTVVIWCQQFGALFSFAVLR